MNTVSDDSPRRYDPTWADITPTDATEWSTCRNCKKPIIWLDFDPGCWVHAYAAAQYLGSRGCRAATFDHYAEHSWDDSIPQSWMAAPIRDVRLTSAAVQAIKATPPKRRPRRGDPPREISASWADAPDAVEITNAWLKHRDAYKKALKDDPDSDEHLASLDKAWRDDPQGQLSRTRRSQARAAMLEEHPERRKAYKDLDTRYFTFRVIDEETYDRESEALNAHWLDGAPLGVGNPLPPEVTAELDRLADLVDVRRTEWLSSRPGSSDAGAALSRYMEAEEAVRSYWKEHCA
jgi:hypothetical protein